MRGRGLPLSAVGFSFIQVMVATMVASALSMSLANYIKHNTANLQGNDLKSLVRNDSSIVQRKLMDDLRGVANINPSCSTNAPTGVSPSTTCSSIPVQSGITPLPGSNQSDVNSMTNFKPPSNITTVPSTISNLNDAFRVAVYNFSGSMNCQLSTHSGNPNPSNSSQQMWVQTSSSACNNKFQVGGLYVITQSFGTTTLTAYANVFQVTDIQTQGSEVQLTFASSLTNLFNQTGYMSDGGYTNEARVFPIKLVEWAVNPGQGLYRREVNPTASNPNGYGNWVLIQADVESLQISPVTMLSGGAKIYNRTLFGLSGTNTDSGVYNIRGVDVNFVTKSPKAAVNGSTYTNPMASNATPDSYPRQSQEFYVNFRNLH